jgi:isoleucyl-tRNA synthetase
VRHAVRGAPASVHLTPYPEVRAERIDDDLERRMRAAMRVVSLGRTARSAAKTKVRTPLPKLIAVFDPSDRDRGALEGQDELAAIIRDELNVKAFEVRDDAKGLVRETVKPELKALGPARICRASARRSRRDASPRATATRWSRASRSRRPRCS